MLNICPLEIAYRLRRVLFLTAFVLVVFFPVGPESIARHAGHDWPMWQYGPARTGNTPQKLADELHLHWTRKLPPPRRAWAPQMDDRDKLEFDLSYSPLAAGGRFGKTARFMRNGDCRSGWKFGRMSDRQPVREAYPDLQ